MKSVYNKILYNTYNVHNKCCYNLVFRNGINDAHRIIFDKTIGNRFGNMTIVKAFVYEMLFKDMKRK